MIKRWIPALIWMVTIFYLSSLSVVPGPPTPFDPSGYIKHVVEYSILGFLLYYAFARTNLTSKKIIIMTLLIGLVYGISDEIHQYFVPGRVFSIGDIIADIVGTLIGASIYIKLRKAAHLGKK